MLSENTNCKVEVTKVEYNQPGTDNGDFIELKVTKKQPGVVSTLLDCGIGAIATYDDSSLLCLVPSSLTALATIVVPADGYIEIGQGQSTVAVSVLPSVDGWLNNTRGEIAILNTALPNGVPIAWLQYGGPAKCNVLSAPVTQVQSEGDTAPNYTNVSCDNTFHLVLSTNAVQKTNADCPSAGGAGGASGSGGFGGSSLGGTGGLSLGGSGGTGGSAATGNDAGSSGEGGEAGAPIGEGGTGNVGGASVAGSGNIGNTGNAGSGGEAGEAVVTPSAGRAGSGPKMVAEGGGCSCSVPNAGASKRTQLLALLGAVIGLGLRRRRARSH